MIAVLVLLVAYVSLGLVYWLYAAYAMWRMGRSVARLGSGEVPPPADSPAVSVIVPACNEAAKLEAATRTLLAQDYQPLEVVLVDDRSTDATGEIMDQLAAADARVKAVHVAELPDGWLGKMHALREGLRQAAGELVLFTDADVHFQPDAVATAVAYLLHRKLDYLTALPRLQPTALLLDGSISGFIRQFVMMARPWAMPDPRSKAFMGVGAFGLFRRSALAATEGLAWLRLEIADDAGLALMMKRSGARCEMVNGFDHVSIRWYASVDEASRSAEKALATPANFSLARVVAFALVLAGLETAPILSLVPLAFARTRAVGLAGLAVLAACALCCFLMTRWVRARALPVVFGVLLAPAAAAALLRAALVVRRRGGIVWRGRLYPAELLRDHQRVRLP